MYGFLRCCHKNHSKTDLIKIVNSIPLEKHVSTLIRLFFDYSIKTNVILFVKRLKKPQEPVISLIPVEQNILILQRMHHQLFVLGR